MTLLLTKQHSFLFNKKKKPKRSLKKMKFGGMVPLPLKSQSGWKFKNKAMES